MSQLLGWQPELLTGSGQTLLSQADGLQRCEGELAGVGAALPVTWSGEAASRATVHTTRRAGEVRELAEVVHEAGLLLQRTGQSLSQAQAALRGLLQEAVAAGCSVHEDGTVSGPLLPPGPAADGEPASASPAGRADQNAAAGALGRRIQAVLDEAGGSDRSCSSGLAALRAPGISPPPRPVAMGIVGGLWGEVQPASVQATAAPAVAPRRTEGFWDHAGDVLGSARDHVADAAGDTLDAARRAVGGVANLGGYALSHPVESMRLLGDGAWMTAGAFGMALGAVGEVGGGALDSTVIGAALGVPVAVVSATVFTAGLGAAARGADGFTRDLTRMNSEAQDAAAGRGADDFAAANRAKLSPEIRKEVDEALERAATGKIRFTAHDGKRFRNWRGDLPPRGDYTEWTAAGPETGRGRDRVIIAGDAARPDVIYYWDHKGAPVRIGP